MTPEQMIEITANIEAHIERRAQEIAAPRIAEVEKAHADHVIALGRQLDSERQRRQDLVREFQRHIASLERQLAREASP